MNLRSKQKELNLLHKQRGKDGDKRKIKLAKSKVKVKRIN